MSQPISSIPLFQLQFNYDSLQNFLETLSNTSNQHADLINKIQQEISSLCTQKQESDMMSKIADSAGIFNKDFNQIASAMVGKFKPENSGNILDDGANKVCNKLNLLSQGVTWLYQRDQEKELRILNLEKQMAKKMGEDEFKVKMNKQKDSIKQAMDQQKQDLLQQLLSGDATLNEQISHFQHTIQEIERKTLWKIQDCEELLKKRVNDEYVDTSIRNLELNLRAEIKRSGRDSDDFDKKLQEVQDSFKSLENSIESKLKNQKQALKDLENNVCQKYVPLPVFNQLQKGFSDKIADLSAVVREIEKNSDQSVTIATQNRQIRNLDNKFEELEKHIINLMATDLAILLGYIGKGALWFDRQQWTFIDSAELLKLNNQQNQ